MRALLLGILLVLALPGAARAEPLGPPAYGPATTGCTQETCDGDEYQSCPAMLEYYGHCRYHPYPAVDWRVERGRPVRAVGDGTIVLQGDGRDGTWPRRPGIFAVLELDEPRGECRFFAYKHLESQGRAVGAHVDEWQVIGYAGDTQSGGVHVHTDCFSSLAGFNTYEAQADWTVRWCGAGGVPRTARPSSLERGREVWFYRCP